MTEDRSFAQPDAASAEPRRCHWCSAEAPDGATHCPACGASLAQRDSLGDVDVPGVTQVDPALQDVEGAYGKAARANLKGDLTIALAVIEPASAIGLVVGEAALNKAKGIVAGLEGHGDVGQVSAAARSVADRLDRESLEAGDAAGPDAQAPAEGVPAIDAAAEPAPPQDPWFDLPPREYDPWAESAPDPWAGAQSDPWAGQPDPWAGAQSDPWSTEGGPWSADLWQDGATTPAAGPDDSPAAGSDGPGSGAGPDSRR